MAERSVGDEKGGSQRETRTIQVWIDFVCPYCFLAEQPLQAVLAGSDVAVEWMPFELRPYPTPTLRPEDDYLPSVWKRSVYPLAARMGIDIRLPTISPQPYSRLAFEGLQFAKEHGKASVYVDAVLRAFFQQDRDIGQLNVLSDIAEAVGLSAASFTAALQEGVCRERHRAALAVAQRMSIRAVPTLLIGDRRIEGMPDAAMLRRMID